MARRVGVEIVGNPASLVRAFRESGIAASRFGAQVNRANLVGLRGFHNEGSRAHRTLSRLRSGFTGLTGFGAGTLGILGVGLAFRKTIGLAASFERTLNVLQAVSGATGRQMHALRAEAIALGNDVTLPATSAKDAADAMTELSKAGLSTKNILGATKGVLQLSAAAQVSNADAAAIAARNLNAFGLQGKEAVHIADLLAGAANATSGDMTEFADALSYTSATAHQAHVPIEDTVAALGELANKGILGTQAGTAFQQMLLRLESPTAKARKEIDKLGISIYDQQGNIRPLRDIIAQFTEKTKGLSDEQRNAALNTIFGSRAIRAANVVLLGGVAAFDKSRKAVNQQGAAARLAGAQNKGFYGALDALKSSLETLAITLGTGLLPVLTRYARGLARWLGDSRNQARIQRALAQAGRVLIGVFRNISVFARGMAAAFRAAWPTIRVGIAVLRGVARAINFVIRRTIGWRVALQLLSGTYLVAFGTKAIKVFNGIARGIKNAFEATWNWLVRSAYKTVLKIIEPFSHIPGAAGSWARHLKTSIKGALTEMDLAEFADADIAGTGRGRNAPHMGPHGRTRPRRAHTGGHTTTRSTSNVVNNHYNQPITVNAHDRERWKQEAKDVHWRLRNAV